MIGPRAGPVLKFSSIVDMRVDLGRFWDGNFKFYELKKYLNITKI
jgi:hypothetical protein